MTKEELIAATVESWQRLDTAIAGLDESAMVEPGVVERWSVKDLLGHVTAWDLLVVERLDRWRRGEPAPGIDWTSADEYNAREAAARSDWTLARVQEEAAETRQRLRALLDSISDDEWTQPATINGRERPLGEWIGGALSGDGGPGTHAAEHAAQIRAWRAARDHKAAP